MQFHATRSSSASQRTACAVVGVYEKGDLSAAASALDEKCGGLLRRVVKRGDFDGKSGSVLPIAELPGAPAERALLVGLGSRSGFGRKAYRKAIAEQPGNQLAGFDLRWSWPGGRVPVALYAQGIGEDEAGFMPAKYLGLFGAESWGDIAAASWRAYAEYADTACDFLNDPPAFGCAYTNVIYTSGYRYRGRALGHAMDADGESVAAGILLLDARGRRWELQGRNVKLNRAGEAVGHSLAGSPARVRDLSVVHESGHAWGTITVSLGFTDVDATGSVAVEDGVRGFVAWRHEIR